MIGSVLADYFYKLGFSIVGIDDLSGGFKRNVQSFVRFYPNSIEDAKSINNIFEIEKPKYVIHTACFAAECLSPWIRGFLAKNMVLGTTNIINASVNNNIEKIIHFSSIARYGDGKPPFKETDSPQPKDIYGIFKLTNELDLKEAYDHFGLKYSIVAGHNILSPIQNFEDKFRNVAAIFIRRFLNNENLQIFGDGLQKRCFTDAKYLCDPIFKLLKNFNGELFNIGSDKFYTIEELAKIVLFVGRGLEIESQSKIEYLEPRIEVKEAIADHSKAKNLLGFKDKTDLEDLIRQMFESAIDLKITGRTSTMDYEINKNMYSYWKI